MTGLLMGVLFEFLVAFVVYSVAYQRGRKETVSRLKDVEAGMDVVLVRRQDLPREMVEPALAERRERSLTDVS